MELAGHGLHEGGGMPVATAAQQINLVGVKRLVISPKGTWLVAALSRLD